MVQPAAGPTDEAASPGVSVDASLDAARQGAAVADAGGGAAQNDAGGGAAQNDAGGGAAQNDGGVKSGTDGGSAAAAELLDPWRPSLAYECDGTPLTLAELLTLFDPGAGSKMLGLAGELTAQSVTRSCAPLTGCSAWTPKSTTAASLAFQLSFSAATLGSMAATAYDAYWGDLGSDAVPVTSGDFLFVTDPYARPKRVRLTRQASGSICASAATTVNHYGSPTDMQDFMVGRGIVSTSPLARSAPAARPALEGAPPLCAGPGATTTDIAAAWFQPGTSTANVPATRYDVASRTCHPITGCTAWAEQHSVPDARDALPIPIRLNVHGADVAVELSRSSTYREYTLSTGQFAGSWELTAQQVSGVVSTTCIGTRTSLKVTTGLSEREQISVGLGSR